MKSSQSLDADVFAERAIMAHQFRRYEDIVMKAILSDFDVPEPSVFRHPFHEATHFYNISVPTTYSGLEQLPAEIKKTHEITSR